MTDEKQALSDKLRQRLTAWLLTILRKNKKIKNCCVSGSPTRQQPSREYKLKFENNMSISHRWWEQIHLLLWQSVIWEQKYDFISLLGNHCNHKCQCMRVCVCLCAPACDTISQKTWNCEGGREGGRTTGREQWADPVVCPITMSEENEQIDNDL